MTNNQILDLMAQMIRVGFVNARQPEKMRVKVTLRDTTGGELITDWLPVLCPRASQDMQYDLPDTGDQVLCLFLSYGLEQGFVVGSMYGKQTPPVQSGDKFHRTFSDGATIEYDRASHALSADIPGTATIKCANSITLEAPIVYVRGTLVNTARDGSPGKSVFSGGMEVKDGGISVPDADVVAAGVSLASHTTEGVQPGSGTSSHPTGGSTDSPGTAAKPVPDMGTAAYEAAVAASLACLQSEVESSDSPSKEIDKLILCLPEIANAMAEKETNEDDKKGWLYLHDMFEKWLAGVANPDAERNTSPFWVDLDWALKYFRVEDAYDFLTSIACLSNAAAQQTLTSILRRDEKLIPEKGASFDYINTEWPHWKPDYFQQKQARGMLAFPPDGLMAAMGNFMLRALAKGTVVPMGQTGWSVKVEEVAIFIWDSFNFVGDASLGYWRCSPPSFKYQPDSGFESLDNENFRDFRNTFGKGNDFLVLSIPKNIDRFIGFEYETYL